MQQKELFEVVDEDGNVINTATRKECHSNKDLIHRVVHIFVCNSKGEIILQKRKNNKDIQPGKWDTSVGGHLMVGETYFFAAKRELAEELGIKNVEIKPIYDYLWKSEVETELVKTYFCLYDGKITFLESEIDDVKFFTIYEIKKNLKKGIFTPNFAEEFKRFLKWSETSDLR